MAEGTGVAAPSPTPSAGAIPLSPTPTLAPDPAPGAAVTVVPLHLTDPAIAVLRERGFLTAVEPTVRDLEAAVMGMLRVAHKVGVHARSMPPDDEAAPPCESHIHAQ
jgi:hypothetical protein